VKKDELGFVDSNPNACLLSFWFIDWKELPLI